MRKNYRRAEGKRGRKPYKIVQVNRVFEKWWKSFKHSFSLPIANSRSRLKRSHGRFYIEYNQEPYQSIGEAVKGCTAPVKLGDQS